MNRNIIFTSAATVAALAAAAQRAGREPKAEARRPNIVFIMADDHAFQAISAYGHGLNRTPNIDRLAGEGMLMQSACVGNSISGPARATILTGKFSHKNGYRDNGPKAHFDGSQQTFPKLLQAAGYRTAVIGKWHLASTPTGFDHYSVHIGQGTYYNPDFIEPGGKRRYEGYATDLTVEHSIDWLATRERDKPFCLMMHFKAPHRNWLPAPEKMAMYEDRTFPVPENFRDDYAGRRAAAEQKMSIDKDMDPGWDLKISDGSEEWARTQRLELSRMTAAQRAAFDKVYVPLSEQFGKAGLTGRELAEYKYQRYLRDYMKVISSVDDAVGRMLDYLKEQGLDRNTLVIYTSDQGFYLGEHGWFDKRFMYEESFRTPMLVRYPGEIPAGRKSAALVQNIDIAPTLLDYAGVAIPADIQGESMRPVLSGKAKAIRQSLYYHYYEFPLPHAVKRHYGVRTDRYKLIRFYYDIDRWELYDLKKDPREMRNVIDDPAYARVKKEMTAELDRLQVEYEDTDPTGGYGGWAK